MNTYTHIHTHIQTHIHTHINTLHIHLCELVDSTGFQSEKQIPQLYLKQRNIIFCLKADHHMNQV